VVAVGGDGAGVSALLHAIKPRASAARTAIKFKSENLGIFLFLLLF
jgi:hypothetical protein